MKRLAGLILIALTTLAQLSMGQNKNSEGLFLVVNVTVERAEDVPMEGASARLFERDSLIDSIVTTGKGKFTFQLPINHVFELEVSKPGFVKKFFNINTAVPENITGDWFCNFSVVLFQPCPELDLSLLKRPLLNLAFNEDKHEFDPMEAYDDVVRDRLQLLLKDNDKCLKRKYSEIVLKADRLYHERKYHAALVLYQDAIDKKNDSYAKKQVADIEKIIQVNKADSLFIKKKYEDANIIYKKVLGEYPNDNQLMLKIQKTDRLVEQKK